MIDLHSPEFIAFPPPPTFYFKRIVLKDDGLCRVHQCHGPAELPQKTHLRLRETQPPHFAVFVSFSFQSQPRHFKFTGPVRLLDLRHSRSPRTAARRLGGDAVAARLRFWRRRGSRITSDRSRFPGAPGKELAEDLLPPAARLVAMSARRLLR